MGQLECANEAALTNLKDTAKFLAQAVKKTGLHQVASASHSFSNGGYTLILALAESHASLHTWPEFNLITCDIYVCNLTSDSTQNAHDFFDEIKKFFQVTKANVSVIDRSY